RPTFAAYCGPPPNPPVSPDPQETARCMPASSCPQTRTLSVIWESSVSARTLANGRTIGGGRFGVGALAYLLKNRFYIGEVVYRGDIHRGEHEPILDSALFAAVQGKLAAQAELTRRT